MGDQIDVVVEALVEPQGARPLGSLRSPRIPADALRSRLSGGVIVCHVAVGPDGQAAADCSGNPPDIPPFVLHRAAESLETVQWQRATDQYGQPCSDLVTVHFRW
jgi:hypothetical protein